MQYELLDFIKCPLTKTNLRFELISEFEKSYAESRVTEVFEGLLFSETGFVFPIIDGIPRLLIESVYDYSGFLEKHLPAFQKTKEQLENKYKGLLSYCVNKNKKTRSSFEFEWNFLNPAKKDKIWHDDAEQLSTVFMNEVGEKEPAYFKDKTIIDVGCGHGIMTTKIAGFSKIAIGVELSKAVENAYRRNQHKNAWYIEGDLQFLPFNNFTFDILYSSGVIHHTNNTELSLSLIEPILKKGGRICLWLYHPQKNILHNLTLLLRKLTSKMPLKLSFIFLLIFVFPVSFLIKKIKRKNSVNYREEIIDLLDGFTPEFRFEVPHDLATIWLTRRRYDNIKITTSTQYGFSIIGEKQNG